ncbi:MAG: transglycosylase SLT domain-containing protein [Crocinitomicaceae bacterium]|nr:transglycosylase SLT domain-containing protein [Crocinitomicaceae bacterium]
MKKSAFISVLFLANFSIAQDAYEDHLIEVKVVNDTTVLRFVKTPELFVEQWDTLAQPNFWKEIMHLSPDSCLLNVASSRQILERTSLRTWDAKTDEQKEAYKQSLREKYNLAADTRIFMTTGKSDFYRFDLVLPNISKGIDAFSRYNTDPWYAQAILMIESPGSLHAKSNAGAVGPFQLMKSVAINRGLRVDKYVDERKDFERSAYASSHLIRTACVPEAKRILSKFGIYVSAEDEFSLWFRLTVLHCYHAGAGNVDGVLTNVVKPTQGGVSLITTIWKSEYGGFKNSSQNYSQLALASLLVLDNLIHLKCDEIKDCKEN